MVFFASLMLFDRLDFLYCFSFISEFIDSALSRLRWVDDGEGSGEDFGLGKGKHLII